MGIQYIHIENGELWLASVYVKNWNQLHAIPYFPARITCGSHRGSFAVRDHLRSNLGEYLRSGIIILRRCTETLADAKKKVYDVAHFSSLHSSLFTTLSTFHDYVSHGLFSTGVSADSRIHEASRGHALYYYVSGSWISRNFHSFLCFFPMISCHI